MISPCGTSSLSVPCSRSQTVSPLDQFESVSSRTAEWCMPCMRGVTMNRFNRALDLDGQPHIRVVKEHREQSSVCQTESASGETPIKRDLRRAPRGRDR